jgi:methionyl aminopeptidase
VEKIARAGDIVSEVFQVLARQARPGIRTAQLDKLAEELIIKRGAIPSFKGYRGYPYTTCLSVNEQVVHGFPGERQLLPGDIVGVDVGAFLNGYHADAATTIAIGPLDQGVSKLVQTTRDCLALAVSMVRPGIYWGDVAEAIEQKAVQNGFEVIHDLFGHGIGQKLHEDPLLPNFGKKGTGPRLKEGMIIAVEPMLVMGDYEIEILADGWTIVTKDGKWSAHEEHTLAITRDGCRILTGQRNYGEQ